MADRSRVVVVTGVNGGLGHELRAAFRAEGMTVAGLDRQPDPKHTQPDADFLYLQADIADAGQVSRAFAEIRDRLGRIDILFCNAAIYPRVNFVDQTPESWSQTFAVNVNGVAYCCHYALPIMKAGGHGRIYVLGSFADIAPIPDSAAYSASKGALHGLVRGIAVDLQAKSLDIQIHEWVPGHMKTQMSDFTGNDPSVSAGYAVKIVKADNASKNGAVFQNDTEWLAPVGLRTRILRKLGLRR